jgi:tRNA wybutosine-synthesizing protein 1
LNDVASTICQALLHERRISTFLVTNAQFPDAIQALPPITQLYVSVDATTPETLKVGKHQ